MDSTEKTVATGEGIVPNKLWWAESLHIGHNEKLNPAGVSAERLGALQRTELLDRSSPDRVGENGLIVAS